MAAGGALGAPARYGVAQVIRLTAGTFPWATLLTNASGSFALALVVTAMSVRVVPAHPLVRRFVATGFLGAYTTYSTFAVETDLLVRDGHPGLGTAYVLASVASGVVAVWAGARCARLRGPAS